MFAILLGKFSPITFDILSEILETLEVQRGLRPRQCSSWCLPKPGEPDVSDVDFYRISSEVRVVVFSPRTFDILSEIVETLEV